MSYADFDRSRAQKRRADLAAEGKCINGASHGPATHGRKCRMCLAVHRYGLVVVLDRGLDNLDLSDRRTKQPVCISLRGAA